MSGVEAALDPVDDEKVRRTVESLRRIVGRVTLHLMMRIGRVVVESFYGGDPEVLRWRGPKDASLRRLAAHPDLPMSAATLYRSVAGFVLLSRIGGVHSVKHVGVGHIYALLPLSEVDQEALLRRADGERWTVQRLDGEVRRRRARQRSGEGARRGRPPLPRCLKTVRRLDRLATEDSRLFDDIEAVGADARAEMLARVHRIRARCESLAQALDET